MLYKIQGRKLQKLDLTRFRQEQKFEEDLEDWEENDPLILGEALLLDLNSKPFEIGRKGGESELLFSIYLLNMLIWIDYRLPSELLLS